MALFEDKSAERIAAIMGGIPPALQQEVETVHITWKAHPDLRCSSLWPDVKITFKKKEK